ncbi:tetratricopeptide repeat protein [Paracraurococcus lichenis]|uniref:Tetratricopeptide repeat protein n=1 Tax=Paracraurococcus lichenis TaxID=3064888 RepID=A0ABT9E078_9PROT|nr:tetratricopeptide repeat protein [Paracraurococcus sp. LOR1-02]MDO9709544.1 tetratricopeptide repeat protein [Paracraurococcus sp. LOR1-02]
MTDTHAPLLQQAAAFHHQGQLAEAERLYKRILNRQPQHFGALYLSGVLALQKGRAARAAEAIGKAIRLNPGVADAHSNLGTALRALGRPQEALASYDRAVALDPAYAEAHANRAAALLDLGRREEALAAYDRALALRPDQPEAEVGRSRVLLLLGRAAEALAAAGRALALDPGLAEAEADRGNALHALGRLDEALASFDRAISLRPGDAGAHANRGVVLAGLGRRAEALASYEQAIALEAGHAEAHANRANLLADLGRPAEALAAYDRALALQPGHAGTLCNRGIALADAGRHAEAVAAFDRAIAADPEHVDAQWNRSLSLLVLGRLEEGWQGFEARKRQLAARTGQDVAREWRGEPIAGRRLFLDWEQGLGDTIQFCRYARLARAAGAEVILSVQAPLLRLLRQFEPEIRVVGEREVPERFDTRCSLMSLPLAFGTGLGSIPAAPAYLAADPALRAAWAARLPPAGRPRIGLVWRGNPGHRNDRNRSMPLPALLPLLREEAAWIGLQRDLAAGEAEVLREAGLTSLLGDAFADFADTAAVVDQLDLVITVDTSVAHLAAALGRPTWIVLPRNPDWRWLLDRADSPWYPSVRLFRQREAGDWSGPVETMRQALRQGPRPHA